jgi:hypothetical protein
MDCQEIIHAGYMGGVPLLYARWRVCAGGSTTSPFPIKGLWPPSSLEEFRMHLSRSSSIQHLLGSSQMASSDRRMLLNPRHAVDCFIALLKCSQEKVGREEGSRQGRGQTTPRSAVGEQGTAGRWARLPSTVTLSFPLLLSTYPLSSHSLLSVPSYPATLSSHSDNVNITHHCFQVQLHT